MLPQLSIRSLLYIVKHFPHEEGLPHALRFHGHLGDVGLEAHKLLGDYLLSFLAGFGSVGSLQEAFDRSVRNEFSWTSLIHGYIKQGDPEYAFILFEKMQEDCAHPTEYTFVAILKACAQLRDVDRGLDLHAEAARKGSLKSDPYMGSVLVDMYSKAGLLEKAKEVFDTLPNHDVVTWTALIGGLADHGHGGQALLSFKEMQLEGVPPNDVTFSCLLRACGSIRDRESGKELHRVIEHRGLLKSSRLVGNTLVDMYAKCGLLGKAQKVLEELPFQDVVAWTALITGYTQHDRCERALDCYHHMKRKGVSPNAFTMSCSLAACGNVGVIDKGREIHSDVLREGVSKLNQFVGNALVDMYAKCGMLARAQGVFDELPAHDLISWNALVTGFALLGDVASVIRALDRMRVEHVKPDIVTFVSILNACSHAGLVEMGEVFFQIMCRGYGISPTLEHHTCIVDLLGRAGQLDKAVAVMKQTPCHPHIVLWLTVLSACRKWENLELAREAFEQAVILDAKEDSAYVCMYNIYAHAKMLEDANKVEAMRSMAGLQGREGEAEAEHSCPLSTVSMKGTSYAMQMRLIV